MPPTDTDLPQDIADCPPLLWLFEAVGLAPEEHPTTFDGLLDWAAAMDYRRQEAMIGRLGVLVRKSSRGQRALTSAFLFAIDFVHIDERARAEAETVTSFLSDLTGTDRPHRRAILALLASK